jgi:hypothetical protein
MRDGALRVHRRLYSYVVVLLSRLPETIGKRVRQLCSDTAGQHALKERTTKTLHSGDRQRPANDP